MKLKILIIVFILTLICFSILFLSSYFRTNQSIDGFHFKDPVDTITKTSRNEPRDIKLPDDISSFMKSLETCYNEKDTEGIKKHLSAEFIYNGLNRDEFIQSMTSSYLFKEYDKVRFKYIDFRKTNSGFLISWIINTDIGFLPQSSGIIPIIGNCEIIKENDAWKLLGNGLEKTIGAFRESIVLEAVVSTNNDELYRKLLPEELSMPENLQVIIKIIYNQKTRSPLTPYMELIVQLACKYKDTEGIFILTLPATAWIPVKFGQTIGYPKYVVDSIILMRETNQISATVTHKNKKLVDFNFSPDLSQATTFEKMSLQSPLIYFRKILPSHSEKPIFLLKKLPGKKWILKGTADFYKIDYLVEQFGKAHIQIDPDNSWSGLIPTDATVKARCTYVRGEYNLKHELINSIIK